ncbi:MAG: beta-galactosidase domain 4-containing protein, partial [Planctomycetota bacterium]
LGRLDVPAGEATEVNLPIEKPELEAGDECFLTLEFSLAGDTRWASAGHRTAWEQFEMPWQAPESEDVLADGSLALSSTSDAYTITGDGFEVKVGRQNGLVESYSVDGRRLVRAPLRPNFWRAPLDNDRGYNMPELCAEWKKAGRQFRATEVRVKEVKEGLIALTAMLKHPSAGETTSRLTYRVRGDGSLEVTMKTRPRGEDLSVLPRVGLQTRVPQGLDSVSWYGRGPWSNYADRRTGAMVGRYEKSVDELVYDYVEPQENGYRTDVRRLTLTDGSGEGLRIVGLPQVGFNVWPYTQQELEDARHPYELTRAGALTLNVDAAQMGVGGDTSWGARPHDQYELHPEGTYTCSFRMEPVR